MIKSKVSYRKSKEVKKFKSNSLTQKVDLNELPKGRKFVTLARSEYESDKNITLETERLAFSARVSFLRWHQPIRVNARLMSRSIKNVSRHP